MLATPFESPAAFRTWFEDGLIELLRTTGELGEDILVLANANFEVRIWEHLRDELRDCFARLATHEPHAEDPGGQLSAAPDDIATLRQILDHGFDTLRPPQIGRTGPWEIQLNPLRAFRPARHSNRAVEGISAPFDEALFHFDKPFLRQEIFWQGELLGHDVALFYNKFPFVDYHGLLVPDLQAHRPQYLTESDFAFIWNLLETLGARLPGFGFGYNSYGAHASVNHLHFQSFLRTNPLPIEAQEWRHNGGLLPYPCRCLRFSEQRDAWRFIDELHRSVQAYNLILTGGACYCLPRKRQGEVAYPAWLNALAWYEMAGGFVFSNQADFARIGAPDLDALMASVDASAQNGQKK